LFRPDTWAIEPAQFDGSDQQTWPQYVFWQVERQAPRVPTFREAEAKVRDAWKMQEARRLARKDGEAILADLKKQTMTGEAAGEHLKQLAGQKGRHFFTINGLARLVSDSTFRGAPITPGYKPYDFPKTEIPYPPRGIIELLARVEKPGEAVTFMDAPEEHVYVAVLVQRTPNMDDSASRKEALRDFLQVYKHTASGDGGNPLWRKTLLPELRKQYQEKVMHQLRLDAAGPDNVDSTGQLKLPRDIRIPDDRRRGGDED
jgi:hypothetical protein